MAKITFSRTEVHKQVWAFLRTVCKFPEKSAAGIIGTWICENDCDPTTVEQIYDEPFEIGSKKSAAAKNWDAFAKSHNIAHGFYYCSKDKKYYPGIAMWSCTGAIAYELISRAKKAGKAWYDLDVQLQYFKEYYYDRPNLIKMIPILKKGNGSLDYLTDCAYGLIDNAGSHPHTVSKARTAAAQIYSKFKGKSFTYTGGSSNNGSNKCEEFVKKALSYKGISASDWAAKHPKWYDAGVWCADFVSACGEEVGILGKVFDGSASAYACAHSVTNYGGKIHTKKSYSPQRGDLINFIWSGGSASRGYADHIGIVTKYKNNTVYTIEGNSSNTVREKSYPRSSSVLACFCSPNWSLVGGTSDASGESSIEGNLFDDLCTRKDAILRECAYLETVYDTKKKKKVKEYKASKKSTDIALSIVNYTELFQTFWEVGVSSLTGSSSSETITYDYSKLRSKVRETIQHLVSKGLNNAAACGIAGNIYYESAFNTAAVKDNKTSFGICRWNSTRGSNMKKSVGSNWANNLTGQLDFLWYELESDYSSLLSTLKSIDNTESGAKVAAEEFVRNFEKPSKASFDSKKRQEKAAEYFNKITQVITSNSSTNAVQFNSVNLKNLSSKRQAAVKRAYAEQGKPYAWGATGPKSYDCSGLVGYCLTGSHSRLGTTDTFAKWSHTNSPIPGDVCLNTHHTGLYIGDQKMIHAPQTGDVVKISEVRSDMWYCVYPGFK